MKPLRVQAGDQVVVTQTYRLTALEHSVEHGEWEFTEWKRDLVEKSITHTVLWVKRTGEFQTVDEGGRKYDWSRDGRQRFDYYRGRVRVDWKLTEACRTLDRSTV